MMCCLDLMEKTMRTVCLSSLSLPFTRLFEAKKKSTFPLHFEQKSTRPYEKMQ